MAIKNFIQQFSYVWKQLVLVILLTLILGGLLVHLYIQKRYTISIEKERLTHWASMRELRQTLVKLSAQCLFPYEACELQNIKVSQIISTFFQQSPELFRLTLLDTHGKLLLGKETELSTIHFHKTFSSASQKIAKKAQTHDNYQSFERVHFIQLPVTFDYQHKGFLRGEFWVNDSNSVYIRITQVTLYITVTASGLMIFFGIFTIFNQITQHLSVKQQKLENYAFSLEQANENLRKAKKELYLSEKLASLGYLAAGIAHEIGNPLSAIFGYVELLQRGTLPQEKTMDILQRVEQETKRIWRIIQELVNFSRPDSMDIQKVDINHLLQHVVSRLPSLKEKQINIQLQLTDFPLFAEIDKHKLQNVFLNIISNAIDAIMSRGEIRISTTRRIRESTTIIGGSEVIAIQFSDTGGGIAEEHLSKIFDPFFTTKEPGRGMGMGLSLCHRIIESLNGEIEVHSTPGQGTDLMVYLPPARQKNYASQTTDVTQDVL